MPNASDEEIRKVLERLLDEQEQPPPPPSLADVLGKWGTRGFVAGLAVGFAIMPLSLLVTGERGINSKLPLAIAMMTGICAVPGALAGLAIGCGVWLVHRNKPVPPR
jgi:hypothetical protein